jgi:hypothetical protein
MSPFSNVVGLIFFSLFALNLHAVERQVSVTGIGEVSAAPDSASVSLTVQSVRRESAAAKDDVDSRVNAFLETIADLGFDEDDVKAGSLQTSPRYDYRSGEPTFAGFQASRTLSVEVTDLDDLDALMDAALEGQIDSINNIEYKVSDSSTLEAKARELAIEHSKQQAGELAAAYGVELGPIVSIVYRSQQVTPVFMEAGVSFRAQAADAGPVGQYLPDQITFSDQIDVVFDLIVNQ